MSDSLETINHSFNFFLEEIEEIFSKLESDSDLSEPLGKFIALVADFFSAKNASIYLLSNRKLTLVSSLNANQLYETELNADDEKRLTASGTIIEDTDIVYFPGIISLFTGSNRSKMLISLNYNDNLLGFIVLGRKITADYGRAEKTFLKLLAETLARIIFKSHSFIKMIGKSEEPIYKQNISDFLTGVYVKNYIEQRLNEGIKEAIRYKKEYSLALVSIDNFNELKKRFGLPAINALLQKTGKNITNLLRKDIDLIGKYSEDTFLILFPSTPKKGVVVFCERLKGKMERLTIEKYPALTVTVSIGVTSIEEKDQEINLILEKALKALDYSKSHGGNTLSYNYEGLISENLSDFEKATGISAKLLKNNLENPFYLTDKQGNEIDFTKNNNGNWLNINRKNY